MTKIEPVSSAGDVDEQHREVAQPQLELGVELRVAEPDGDLAELGLAPGATTTPQAAAGVTTVPMRAQEASSARAAGRGDRLGCASRRAATRR